MFNCKTYWIRCFVISWGFFFSFIHSKFAERTSESVWPDKNLCTFWTASLNQKSIINEVEKWLTHTTNCQWFTMHSLPIFFKFIRRQRNGRSEQQKNSLTKTCTIDVPKLIYVNVWSFFLASLLLLLWNQCNNKQSRKMKKWIFEWESMNFSDGIGKNYVPSLE